MRDYGKTRSAKEMREVLGKALTFDVYKENGYTLYENKERPELGSIRHYERSGCYDILIGNYICPEDFRITFDHRETILRLGTVYAGHTKVKMFEGPASSFTPSSFFAVEKDPKGQQVWMEGQHFQGTEVMIYPQYINDTIREEYQDECICIGDFTPNTTYRYLTGELVEWIHKIERLSARSELGRLRMESMIMECLAVLSSKSFVAMQGEEVKTVQHGKIKVGNREMTLTIQDVELIQKAHEILEKDACLQPTISELSERLQINPQKLKAGFVHMYQMTIWEFANSVRMTAAASLLSTTDKGIVEIAELVGYASPASFHAMFKRMYGISPKEFRTENFSRHKQ